MPRSDASKLQAIGNPSEVAKGSGTPNSWIVTCPQVARRALRAKRSSQQSREWARSARERGADSTARLAEMGSPIWTSTRLSAQEPYRGSSVNPTTPVTPEQRRVSDDQWM